MGSFLAVWLGQTVNGLILGNIYALLAAGLALIFGVAGLVNFAHGSVYMAGSYAGWVAMSLLGWPLWAALPAAAAVGALVGLGIERFAVRPFRRSPHVSSLLATIGAGMILDDLAEIVFTPNPRSFPSAVPARRFSLGLASVGVLDLVILGASAACAASLFALLRYTKAGRALRAASQDSEAAQFMGVRVSRMNAAAFALASALGAIAGVLVGLYYNFIVPSSGLQAALKGFTACVLGGLSSVPASMAGGLLLGLGESYGVAIFGASARDLVAYALLLGALFLRPNGVFGGPPEAPREALTGSFLPRGRSLKLHPAAAAAAAVAAALLPLAIGSDYLLQVLAGAWIMALFALSLSLVGGMGGVISLGQAGLMAIGAYASALLSVGARWAFLPSFLASALLAAAIGTLLATPALRLKGHYVAIATLGIGEIVDQAILNWDSLTRGALGIAGIPAPRILGLDFSSVRGFYYLGLAALALGALAFAAVGASPLGRTIRAIREDEVAAASVGIDVRRYKALTFGLSALLAGAAGSLTAYLYTYISYETFGSGLSILGIAMAILGGFGNLWGAILGALVLSGLPELLRFAAEYRSLVYGLALIAVLRFRPRGILGGE